MTNKETAIEILKLVGGEDNVTFVTHCATRLRFVLKDSEKANLNALDKVEGVLKAQNKGGQLQVVIGAKVDKVYAELTQIANISNEVEQEEPKKRNPFNAALETIAGIFTPILPALVGCGMVKCVSTILTTMGVFAPTDGFIVVANIIGDCIFYFMPFFLASSAARKFKTSECLAIALAGCLMYPTIMEGAAAIAKTGVNSFSFLGLPVLFVKYSSTVIPIILSVWVMSYVYKFVNKWIPDVLKVILVPMIVLFIMVPVELVAIGPFGSYVGTWLSGLITSLFDASGILAGFFLGFFRPILVMFGMHYSIMPMQIQQVAELGYTVMIPSALAANLAQAGAVFGVFLLTHDKTIKGASGSSTISAMFGVTEPAIYGVNLKFKKPFFAGCLAGGIVSAFFGIIHASATAIALPGVLALGTYQADSYILIIVGVIASFLMAMTFTLIACKNDFKKSNHNSKIETAPIKVEESPVFSPMDGEVIALSNVDDTMFSQELLGKGAAIQPANGNVYAPFDGEVQAMFKTNHAIGLRNEKGVELLIHIGMDTVNLEGKHFSPKVTQGQKVSKGDLLLTFDLEAIKAEGYDVTTPVVVTNTIEFETILSVAQGTIQHGEPLLDVE